MKSTDLRQSVLMARNQVGSSLNRARLKNHTFTIISNDCWGGELYKDLNLQYQSPFVGLFVMAPCYVQLLQALPEHLNAPLTFTETSRYPEINAQRSLSGKSYPIGLLKNAELHFVHAKSQEEAYEKWSRRLERVAWSNLFIKMSGDKDGCTTDHLAAFDALPYANKVCFVATPQPQQHSCVYVPDYISDGARMYRKSLCHFDVIGWLNGRAGDLAAGYKLVYSGLYRKGT